jgi:hypothetical protein
MVCFIVVEGVIGMLPRIPKKMCNQSIALQVPTGEEDDYGKQKTVEQEINNVLVQPQTIYAGSSNSRTITANAIVFLFAGISDPLPKITPDWVGTHLKFEGRDYTITNIVDNREPYNNKVYSYELEVL